MSDFDESEISVSYHRNNKDHFLKDGETLCHHGKAAGGEEKPYKELTDREKKLLSTSNHTCSKCNGEAQRMGIIPTLPDDVPQFVCPECGEEPRRITKFMGELYATHEGDEKHRFDGDVYERWRRGEDVSSQPN